MLESAKNRAVPLWLLVSCLVHVLILLIPLISRDGGERPGRGRLIELVEMGESFFGGEGGLSAEPPVPITLPQTQPFEPAGASASSPEVALQSSQPEELKTEVEKPTAAEVVAPVPAAPQETTPKAGAERSPTAQPVTPARDEGDGTQERGDKGGSSGGGVGSGKGQATGPGGDIGSGGPNFPSSRVIRSTKALMNTKSTLTLSAVVEIRPDGSFEIIQPLPKGNPASSRAEEELKNLRKEFASLASDKPYKLKITFNYYPRNIEGLVTFDFAD